MECHTDSKGYSTSCPSKSMFKHHEDNTVETATVQYPYPPSPLNASTEAITCLNGIASFLESFGMHDVSMMIKEKINLMKLSNTCIVPLDKTLCMIAHLKDTLVTLVPENLNHPSLNITVDHLKKVHSFENLVTNNQLKTRSSSDQHSQSTIETSMQQTNEKGRVTYMKSDDYSTLTPSIISGSVTNVINLERSEDYDSRKVKGQDAYRDDEDPGYRIRDIWEIDLINEIQAREKGDDSSISTIPYFPVFSRIGGRLKTNQLIHHCPQSESLSQSLNTHHPQQLYVGIGGHLSANISFNSQTIPTDIKQCDSTEPLSKHPIEHNQQQHRITPHLHQDTFNHCVSFQEKNGTTHSEHPLNYVPTERRLSSVSHDDQFFDTVQVYGPSTFGETNEASSSSSSCCNLTTHYTPIHNLTRHISPSFGTDLSEVIPNTCHDDNNQDNYTLHIPIKQHMMNTQQITEPHFGTEDLIKDCHLDIQDQHHSKSAISSPKLLKQSLYESPLSMTETMSTNVQVDSPVFGLDIVANQLNSDSVLPQKNIYNSSSFNLNQSVSSLSTHSQGTVDNFTTNHCNTPAVSSLVNDLHDELAFCSPQPIQHIKQSLSSTCHLTAHSLSSMCQPLPIDQLTDAIQQGSQDCSKKDEELWTTEYCDGIIDLHRWKKKKEKLTISHSLHHPLSDNLIYPIKESEGRVIDCLNLKVIFERSKTGFEEFKEFQVKIGMSIAGRFIVEGEIGQAAFSKALRCYDTIHQLYVCIKVIKNDKDYVDQCLDEIKLLRYINYNSNVDQVHCVRLHDFFYYKEHLFIVTELLQENLYDFGRMHRAQKNNYFTIGRIQRIALQILQALRYVHSLKLIHSDLKPENILIKDSERCQIKLIDFGSSCFEDDVLSLYVQSRSYRAPEVLLGLPYDQKIDIWSLGCVLAELWTGYVLFMNDSVSSLLARIVSIIGLFPHYMVYRGKNVSDYFTQDGQLFQIKKEPVCPKRGKRIRIFHPKRSNLTQRMRSNDTIFIDFLQGLLQIDPVKRPTAVKAMTHPWLEPNRYSDGL